jgi:hypothetical protein
LSRELLASKGILSHGNLLMRSKSKQVHVFAEEELTEIFFLV